MRFQTEGVGQDTPLPEPDQDQLGYSLANVKETILALLDASAARSVIEIGAYRGQLTAELLRWASSSGAQVLAVDPEPPAELLELAQRHPELKLIQATSHDALGQGSVADAVIIDGDHNYYTVSNELRLIAEHAEAGDMPLVMFHDVAWPLARRDTYHVPERIPKEYRQPLAESVGLSDEPSFSDDDRPFAWLADHEGGPRNGVLTAIEDHIEGRPDLRLAVIPAFFGFGVLWSDRSSWSDAVARIVEPLEGNPLLERLERNRVVHLLQKQGQSRELRELRARADRQAARLARQEALLRGMLNSTAFALAERISRLRQRGRPAFSRADVERALRD